MVKSHVGPNPNDLLRDSLSSDLFSLLFPEYNDIILLRTSDAIAAL